ncbi:MAG: tRNA (guanine(46)-N(7))-methyltransferase TrmB [Holosporales bacterium]|jgi:tRNA (guanine-N7-)-methyltransferase|nr:tRNA (guanine(46)-N(7))-methyltransferase TrmB [Holosporales bacterium]
MELFTSGERLYGRRRAHRLREGQQEVLSTYNEEEARAQILSLFQAPILFPHVKLEIGFGTGEHLLTQASSSPQTAFIGVEPFENGFIQVLRQREAFPNVFLYQGDGRNLLPLLPPASLEGVYLLFPDPWPKRRHQKRRLLGKTLLQELSRLVKPAGEVRFASDCLAYAASVLSLVDACPDWVWNPSDPRRVTSEPLCSSLPLTATERTVLEAYRPFLTRPDTWPVTRYETKARSLGHSCCYLSFLKT